MLSTIAGSLAAAFWSNVPPSTSVVILTSLKIDQLGLDTLEEFVDPALANFFFRVAGSFQNIALLKLLFVGVLECLQPDRRSRYDNRADDTQNGRGDNGPKGTITLHSEHSFV